VRRQLDREAGLAGAGRPDHGDEPPWRDGIADGREVGVAADEAGPVVGHAGGGREVEGGIVEEDHPLELAQLRAGREAELGERAPGGAVGGERVGLAPAAVERDHQLPPGALAQRIRGDGGAQRGQQLVVAALRQPALGQLLLRGGAQLLEALALGAGAVVVRQLGQRRPADERQRLGEQRLCRGCVGLAAGGGDERLEAVGVGLAAQLVAVVVRLQLGDPRHAQARHVGPHDLQRVRRRPRRPQHVDHAIGRDHLVAVQDQQREQRPLLRASQIDLAAVLPR
jgi:hypothetical protein